SKGGGSSAGSNGWFIAVDATSLEVVFKNNGVDAFVFNTPANLILGDGSWHHVVAVMTFDTVTSGNNAAVFYVDGVNVGGTASNNSLPALSNLTVKWGVRDELGTLRNFYTGKIDDARIYNFALSPLYVAVGDSITAGSDDTFLSDGQGFEPILSDLLTAAQGPVLIANVGVSGATSADGAASIFATLATYPAAQHYLILSGSNDAFIPPV